MTNLKNLEPTIKALADVGPDLAQRVGLRCRTFPYTQSLIDRAVRGDYMNLFVVIDLTIPRLKRTLFLGTRWGEEDAKLVPAPGDPWYLNYTYDPTERAVGAAPTGRGGAAWRPAGCGSADAGHGTDAGRRRARSCPWCRHNSWRIPACPALRR